MYKIWAFGQKKKEFFQTHFWQSVDSILWDVSAVETNNWWLTINSQTTIMRCSKQYGSPTRVTRFKVAPNMSDPTSCNIQSTWSIALTLMTSFTWNEVSRLFTRYDKKLLAQYFFFPCGTRSSQWSPYCSVVYQCIIKMIDLEMF